MCHAFVVAPSLARTFRLPNFQTKLAPYYYYYSSSDENTKQRPIIRNPTSHILLQSSVGDIISNSDNDRLYQAYKLFGILSAVAWVAVSLKVLSYHPDPKFVHCSLKHNFLTMAQAFAFPLPVLWGTIRASSTMYLGVTVASLWLAAAASVPSKFAFGYDLIRPAGLKAFAATIHTGTAILALQMWKKRGGTSNMAAKPLFYNQLSTLYSLACAGLVWFTALPLLPFAGYPLATIPSILGKRLSRPASAFYFLAAVASGCIAREDTSTTADQKTTTELRTSLAVGSFLHLFLLLLKVIGVDDGGLLFPGNGLWQWYPAMMAVPFTAASSFVVHALLVYAGTRGRDKNMDE
jgi:hypothetical protein